MADRPGWKINHIVSIDFSYNLKTFALIVIVYVFFLKFSLEIPLMDVFRRINLPIGDDEIAIASNKAACRRI